MFVLCYFVDIFYRGKFGNISCNDMVDFVGYVNFISSYGEGWGYFNINI